MGKRRLGVLGGTFDPIHYGHLRLAEQALVQLGLERVIFVPAGSPPHKLGQTIAPAKERLLMANLATATNPLFDVDDRETRRRGPSFTVDTLDELKREHPEADFYFLIGADAALEMHTWRDPAGILARSHLVIGARPGFDLSRLREVPVRDLESQAILVETLMDDVSSTAIRGRVQAGMSIRYLTPEAVMSFITKQALYRGTTLSGGFEPSD